MEKITTLYSRIRTHKYAKLFLIAALLVIIAVVIVLSLAVRAVVQPSSLEAESTASAGITVSDTSASSGSAVKFAVQSGGGAVTCNLNATTANFSTQVSAATAGQTVCLASGSYGTWTGTNKAITITEQASATASMDLDFNTGDSNFTIDGLTINGGSIVNGANHITIKNSAFTSSLIFDGVTNSSILLDTDTFNNQDDDVNCTQYAGRINFPYGSSTPSGVTIQNSMFNGGNKDGIQASTGATILNNTFMNIREKSVSDCQHTDSIQGVGAANMVVTGNLFHDNADGVVEFEGSDNWIVTNNACYNIDRGSCITLYSDNGSTVEHNSVRGGLYVLEIDHKTQNPAGSGTIFRNNVGDVTVGNGSAMSVNTKNLYSGASSPNISGVPVFVGGASPTTWAGFKLSGGSPGVNAATDGTNIGIN